jgi:hypothetical protein
VETAPINPDTLMLADTTIRGRGCAAADTPVTIVREGRHAQEVVIRFAAGRACLAQGRCLQVVI